MVAFGGDGGQLVGQLVDLALPTFADRDRLLDFLLLLGQFGCQRCTRLRHGPVDIAVHRGGQLRRKLADGDRCGRATVAPCAQVLEDRGLAAAAQAGEDGLDGGGGAFSGEGFGGGGDLLEGDSGAGHCDTPLLG
ncbi:hypothetical protein D3C78_684250 [compost metagenome]